MSTTSSSGNFLTYPSVSATIFDVPEPKDISAKFVYNYFLPNERESTDTYVDEENFNRHGGRYARQVEVNFSPLSAVVPDSPALTEIQLSSNEKLKLLRNNKKKIFKENYEIKKLIESMESSKDEIQS